MNLFETKEFCTIHIAYLVARISCLDHAPDNILNLISHLKQIRSSPHLLASHNKRGEYMAIEQYLNDIDPNSVLHLQDGRSRNNSDILMITTKNNIYVTQLIKRLRPILLSLSTLSESYPNLIIECFTQGQFSGTTTFNSLLASFSRQITDIFSILNEYIIDPPDFIFYAGPGQGSEMSYKWSKYLDKFPYSQKEKFTPHYSVGSLNYILNWFHTLSVTSSLLMQVVNTIYTYFTKSTHLSSSFSLGKSSAIPGKQNYHLFERCEILSNGIISSYSSCLRESLLCGLYNEYRVKNFWRSNSHLVFLQVVEILHHLNKFLSSVVVNESESYDVRSLAYQVAEHIAIKTNSGFRDAYNLVEKMNTSTINNYWDDIKNELHFLSPDYSSAMKSYIYQNNSSILNDINALEINMSAKRRLQYNNTVSR